VDSALTKKGWHFGRPFLFSALFSAVRMFVPIFITTLFPFSKFRIFCHPPFGEVSLAFSEADRDFSFLYLPRQLALF
jgi:hypothetical protein